MGGEPTFVSIDDRDGAEWNTAPWGRTKRGLSAELFTSCATHYAPKRLPALRPGQVVPRRATAALGAQPVTGARRPADLAQPALFADEQQAAAYTARRQRFILGVLPSA
jgi:uncharacterized protein (DUF2126 family)